MKRRKICIVATIPFAFNMYMKPHIAMLSEKYDVTLISNGSAAELGGVLNEHVRFISMSIDRKISPRSDLRSLIALWRVFRRERYDVVHSLMPKTALLAMVAARLAGVPHRVHTFTGQVWANKSGVARWGLRLLDKIIAGAATDLLTDSASQRAFLIAEKVVSADRIEVLGQGSICGVDIERFRPDPERRRLMREALGIPADAIVYLYLGRLNPDKGIEDLAQAFRQLTGQLDNVHLLVVGPDESGIEARLVAMLAGVANRFHRVGYTDVPEHFMACADIFCLPSYREGFGSVVIEAAATGIPSVASNIYGLSDALVEGDTGFLHAPRSVPGIAAALKTMSENDVVRKTMGDRARARVHRQFTTQILRTAMDTFYTDLLGKVK